ncbi:PAS domain S-box protein [Desertifilum sp. FACHB-1129]|nr:PAS domain S-box protein [Desertifilum sp. FACHB-868]MBD2314730.1 PAS domain S-box protein [Desertifilum sp. FACHB-1129]MBD2330217.1 PAS domain S-box protein [Desertifilum sp. FACHB-868]MDA0211140.1 PAS domain S-box protein [Cyanobacteria bacterium FC1]
MTKLIQILSSTVQMTTNPPNSGRAVVCTSTSSDDLASVDPFFALSPDLQGIWNIEGYFEQLNPAWQAVLGWTPAQLQSCPYWEWVHPHDRANTRSQVQQLNSDRPTATFFNRFRAADGAYQWLWWQVTLDAGKQRWYAIARDINRTHAFEQAEAQYRSIYENAVEGIFQTTPEGQYINANPALARIYGYDSVSEMIAALTDIEHQLYVNPQRRADFIAQLQQHDTLSNFEAEIYRRDRTIIWISEKARIVRDRSGNILYFEGFVEDITERKQAEAAKQRSERRLKNQQTALIQLAKCPPIYTGDLQAAWRTITETACTTLEVEQASLWLYRQTQLICADFYDRISSEHRSQQQLHPQDSPEYFQALESNSAIAFNSVSYPTASALLGVPIHLGHQTVGLLCIERTGASYEWLLEEQNFASYLAYMASLAMEASDRAAAVKAAAQSATELEQSLSLLRATLESTADGIVAVDLLGNILTYNQKFVEMWKMPPALLQASQSERLEFLQDSLNDPQSYQERIYELEAHPEREAYDLIELKDGRVFERYSLPQRLGDNIIGRVWSFCDITEGKKIERLKNEFVSMVSHELRTPLTSIRGSLSLMMGGVVGELPAPAKSLIEIAYKNSERLVLLINDILDIEKIESGKMDFSLQPFDLVSLVEQAIEANRAYGEQFGVSFCLETEVENIQVNVDSTRLMQVMANLLSNAAKFSPLNDVVTVQIQAQLGEWVQVSVRDRGAGIPEAFRSQIFQKFAQADSSDSRQKGGTGLGLSISKAIIERLGGEIGFDTEVDRGTTFYFSLPQWRSPEAALPSVAPHQPRILICEDDPDIAHLLSLMLANGGYQTDIAYNASQAKQRLAQTPCPYVAMTLDLAMPDQDGISLMRELHDSIPHLAIVIVSASAQQGRKALSNSEFAVVDWLDKPIDRDRLMSAIKQAVLHHPGCRPKILHVEDDLDILRIVSAILAEVADIIPAHTLSAAHHFLARESFDLVILDIGLPDGYGLELLPQLKSPYPGGQPIPVVIFSAQEVSREVSAKIAAKLVKTRTSNQELLDTIKSLVSAHHPCGLQTPP